MKKLTANICRVIVGVLFIFSGMVKADDPIGFGYKLDEYWDAFHTPFLSPFSLSLASFMCILEVSLGIALLLGFRMKLTSWLLLLLSLFFTFLTAFAAITGSPKECGCFGDAISLTAWQTFFKDVVLTGLVFVIFYLRDTIPSLFSNAFRNLLLTLGVLAVCAFTYYCYAHLPVWDFRAYKVGNNIELLRKPPAGAKADVFETKFIYKDKHTGKVKEFTEADYPWKDTLNWQYVDTKSVMVQKGDDAKITDLFIYDSNNRDVTDSLLLQPNFTFWVIMPDINLTNKNAFTKLNDLVKACDKHHINLIGITSSDYNDYDTFRHNVNAAFPFYRSDNTVLRTMIRSNPGLMLMKAGVVMEIWHYNDIPTWDEVAKQFSIK